MFETESGCEGVEFKAAQTKVEPSGLFRPRQTATEDANGGQRCYQQGLKRRHHPISVSIQHVDTKQSAQTTDGGGGHSTHSWQWIVYSFTL